MIESHFEKKKKKKVAECGTRGGIQSNEFNVENSVSASDAYKHRTLRLTSPNLPGYTSQNEPKKKEYFFTMILLILITRVVELHSNQMYVCYSLNIEIKMTHHSIFTLGHSTIFVLSSNKLHAKNFYCTLLFVNNKFPCALSIVNMMCLCLCLCAWITFDIYP